MLIYHFYLKNVFFILYNILGTCVYYFGSQYLGNHFLVYDERDNFKICYYFVHILLKIVFE